MEILYIIGNGFDINVKMKTKYSDFYEYYKTTESKSIHIKKLKDSISKGILNWSDLELTFGKYTSQLNTIEEFDEVYDDIIDNLCDYLIYEEEKFDFSKISQDKFLKYLCNPEKSLPQEDLEEILLQKNDWKNVDWNIRIMSFNYTRTIEKIIRNESFPILLSKHHNNSIYLKSIHHIHGFTDKQTILGVNDISQIDKLDFHENEDIVEALVKTKCNRGLRHNVDRLFEKYISEASLICIFGSSLGDTDNYWWKLVGNSVRDGAQLIIFKKGEGIKQRFGHKTVRSRKAIMKLFLDKTDLSSEEKIEAQNLIHIGIDTDMFNIIE